MAPSISAITIHLKRDMLRDWALAQCPYQKLPEPVDCPFCGRRAEYPVGEVGQVEVRHSLGARNYQRTVEQGRRVSVMGSLRWLTVSSRAERNAKMAQAQVEGVGVLLSPFVGVSLPIGNLVRHRHRLSLFCLRRGMRGWRTKIHVSSSSTAGARDLTLSLRVTLRLYAVINKLGGGWRCTKVFSATSTTPVGLILATYVSGVDISHQTRKRNSWRAAKLIIHCFYGLNIVNICICTWIFVG